MLKKTLIKKLFIIKKKKKKKLNIDKKIKITMKIYKI